jgi:hypothetical protein
MQRFLVSTVAAGFALDPQLTFATAVCPSRHPAFALHDLMQTAAAATSGRGT